MYYEYFHVVLLCTSQYFGGRVAAKRRFVIYSTTAGDLTLFVLDLT